jgi:hypothetical protein
MAANRLERDGRPLPRAIVDGLHVKQLTTGSLSLPLLPGANAADGIGVAPNPSGGG